MPRYIAFLRAINVGGHLVEMDALRRLFVSLDFSNVETFIASGNVIFETASKNAKSLEKKIEAGLREALGYEVATFLRTDAELAGIASYQPFRKSDLEAAAALNLAFLKEPPDEASTKKLMSRQTKLDYFHVREREVYWLCRKKQSESTFSNAALEKTMGVKSTLRMNTIQRMAAKYAPKSGKGL